MLGTESAEFGAPVGGLSSDLWDYVALIEVLRSSVAQSERHRCRRVRHAALLVHRTSGMLSTGGAVSFRIERFFSLFRHCYGLKEQPFNHAAFREGHTEQCIGSVL